MEEHEPATTTTNTRIPTWIPIILGLQFLLAIIILGLSAYIIHGKYFDTLGFTIFTSLLTWLVIVFTFVTLYVPSFKHYRTQYVALGIDAVMVIFWLSAMGAAAALRASFKYSVTIDGCYNDGSLVNSSTCIVERDLEKRAAVATSTGLSILSAIAGLSALEMLLFVATLVFGILEWNKTRSRTSITGSTPPKQNEGYQMETPQTTYAQPAQPAMQQQQYTQSYPQETYAQGQHEIPSQTQTQAHTYQPNLPAY